MKILVTSGATREPIDAVRFISNVSTGATGVALADTFRHRGYDVTHLRGTGAIRSGMATDSEEFSTAEDLRQRLKSRLATGQYDLVVMCAAVADYRPQSVQQGKIRSDAPELTISLVRNAKILPLLKAFSPRPVCVIGFKLTAGANPTDRMKAVNALFAQGGIDGVVSNDLVTLGNRRTHHFAVHHSKNDLGTNITGAPGLAMVLEMFLPSPDQFGREGS